MNGGSWGDWSVRDQSGKTVLLPAFGWLAVNRRTGFYEFSAMVDGSRVDSVRSSEFEFLDGRGKRTRDGNLEARGSVALRHKDFGIELIDIYGNDRIGFRANASGKLTAFDPEGKALGPVPATVADGWVEFEPVAGARSYRFTAVPNDPLSK